MAQKSDVSILLSGDGRGLSQLRIFPRALSPAFFSQTALFSRAGVGSASE